MALDAAVRPSPLCLRSRGCALAHAALPSPTRGCAPAPTRRSYYWSKTGIALSAALRHDYMGVGYAAMSHSRRLPLLAAAPHCLSLRPGGPLCTSQR